MPGPYKGSQTIILVAFLSLLTLGAMYIDNQKVPGKFKSRGDVIRNPSRLPSKSRAQTMPKQSSASCLLSESPSDGSDSVAASSGLPTAQDPKSMEIMTFNLRHAKGPAGEGSWIFRRDLVVDVIKHHQPTILGTQEPIPVQVEYLMTHLGPNYQWFGACRSSDVDGMRVAVLYDTRRLRLEKHGDFWLSETPHVPGSKSWDSSSPRFTSWGKFLRKDLPGEPNEAFYFFNTHLDHSGPEARIRGAALILKKMEEIMGKDSNGTVAFLTGDFNSNRTEQPWKLLTGQKEFESQRGSLIDLWQIARERINAVDKTFHDYNATKVLDYEGLGHVDFLFCRPKSGFAGKGVDAANRGVNVSKVEVIIDGNDDGVFPSDHFPVSANISF